MTELLASLETVRDWVHSESFAGIVVALSIAMLISGIRRFSR